MADIRHRGSQVTSRKFASHAEADQHDLEYWRQIPAAERVLYAWRLSVEQWQLANLVMNPDFVDLLRALRDADARFRRIDLLTELTVLTFDEAWPTREQGQFGEIVVDVIGREAFIRNKRATGRAKDLGDVEGW